MKMPRCDTSAEASHDVELWRFARRLGRRRASAGCLAAGLLFGACTDEDAEQATAVDRGVAADGGLDAAISNDDDDDSVTGASVHDAGMARPDHDGHAPVAVHAQCGRHYSKDPRDDTMTGEPVRVVTSDNGTPDDPSDDPYDVLLPQEMLDWLGEQNWVQAHGDWHNVRGWDQGCLIALPGVPCQTAEALAARGLSRASIQSQEPGDGYDFLVMHRHMIRTLQEVFPKHANAIRGFEHIPNGMDDPENPIPWIDVRWSDTQLEVIEWMENIQDHIDAFESEDDYAKWVQFGDGFALVGFGDGGLPPGFAGFGDGGFPGGAFPFGDGGVPPGFPGGGFPGGGFPGVGGGAGPSGTTGDGDTPDRPVGSIHTGLHAQWNVAGSPSTLIDNNKNLQNLAFWRLHVWMDEMWERFRRARGIGEGDPEYQQALVDQCDEMHVLAEALPIESEAVDPDAGMPALETGVFATQVAPVLMKYCGGSCHGSAAPMRGLALAGAPASKIRAGLVGRPATESTMALVEPGEPEQSWLYRKLTGDFAGVDCGMGQCTTMPPAGMAPTDEELERIRSWIADGAVED